MPLLRSLAIELTNTCDRRCGYCYGRQQTRSEGFMTMHRFAHIIHEVQRNFLLHRVALNFNGESLLHPQFRECFTLTQRAGKRIRINTNRFDLFLATQKRFDWTVSFHDDADSHQLYSWDMHKSQLKTNPIIPRNLHVPNRQPSKMCQWPFKYMAILWNGDVTTCCHDLEGRNVIGNVERRIAEFWQGSTYKDLRYACMHQGKPDLPACQECNLY